MSLKALLFAIAFALFGGDAWADDPFAQIEPLPAEELQAARAGFLSVNGIAFAFSIVTQTHVNGDLALRSQLQVDGGRSAYSVAFGAGHSQQMDGDGASLILPGADGATLLQHRINASHLVNLVATSASNQTIRQETAVFITLPGFAQHQADFARDRTFLNLFRIMGVR